MALAAFHTAGVEGEIVQTLSAGKRLVLVHVDGDLVPDMAFRLEKAVAPTLTAADFIL